MGVACQHREGDSVVEPIDKVVEWQGSLLRLDDSTDQVSVA